MRAEKRYNLNGTSAAELRAATAKFPTLSPLIGALHARIDSRETAGAAYLDKNDVEDLRHLGVRTSIRSGEVSAFSFVPAVERHISNMETLPANTVPQKYFEGFTTGNIISCAWRALKKSALLIPIGILASGLKSTGFLASAFKAVGTTLASVGNFVSPLSGAIGALTIGSTVSIALAAMAAYVVYAKIKGRMEKNMHARAQAGINSAATQLHPVEEWIATGLSAASKYWLPATACAGGLYFIGEFAAKNAFGKAFGSTIAAALKSVSSIGGILANASWTLPLALFAYELAKLRHEKASQTTAAKERLRAEELTRARSSPSSTAPATLAPAPST